MSKEIPNQFEQKEKHIFTPEEVHEVLKQMVKGEYQETKRNMDEQGNLYRLDAVAQGTEEGETIELFYIRKGRHANGDQASANEVHSVYVKNGSYGPAGPQASFIDGKWVFMD